MSHRESTCSVKELKEVIAQLDDDMQLVFNINGLGNFMILKKVEGEYENWGWVDICSNDPRFKDRPPELHKREDLEDDISD